MRSIRHTQIGRARGREGELHLNNLRDEETNAEKTLDWAETHMAGERSPQKRWILRCYIQDAQREIKEESREKVQFD